MKEMHCGFYVCPQWLTIQTGLSFKPSIDVFGSVKNYVWKALPLAAYDIFPWMIAADEAFIHQSVNQYSYYIVLRFYFTWII